MTEKFVSSVDLICCVSNWILNEKASRILSVKKKLRLIYNGLSMPEILPSPLSFSPPILLLLGRLSPEKGFDTAIKAFALLKKEGSDAQLLIAGWGDQRSFLENLVAELGLRDSVRFVGKVPADEVLSLINQATLVLIPSYEEAFGLVALEAMQMKRPVIASRVGGLPEIISDGETGIFVPPRDPVALCGAIQDLLADPETAKQMGARGPIRAAQFSLDRNAIEYEQAYAELLQSRT